jgi:hypothetical protein
MYARFCKLYGNLHNPIVASLSQYVHEVRARTFPESKTHTYNMEKGEAERFEEWRLAKESKEQSMV